MLSFRVFAKLQPASQPHANLFPLTPPFPRPFFSNTYTRPLAQTLSFDTVINARGCRGVSPLKYRKGYLKFSFSGRALRSLFSLFAQRVCHNSSAIMRFRTLCAKHPGAGALLLSRATPAPIWSGRFAERLIMLNSHPSSPRTSPAPPAPSISGTRSGCLSVKLSDSLRLTAFVSASSALSSRLQHTTAPASLFLSSVYKLFAVTTGVGGHGFSVPTRFAQRGASC